MKMEEKVLDLFSKNRLKGYKVDEVVQALQASKRTVEYALSKLKSSGRVCHAFGLYSHEFKIVSMHPKTVNKGLKRFDMLTNTRARTIKTIIDDIASSNKHVNKAEFYEPNANAFADCYKKFYESDIPNCEFIEEQYD